MTIEIENRKARYNYHIEETYEAGIVLKGTEIKSIRNGSANLNDAYGIIRNGELFLLNMFIHRYDSSSKFNHDETRTRKLLMHKHEILKIQAKIQQLGYTLVPLKLYFKDNKAKILLGLAKGKKKYDKRESIKKREQERELRRTFKQSTLA
jgi:SsrA-binding protein